MWTSFKQYGLAVASGVLLALSFPAWGLFPLAWCALVPLFVRVSKLPPLKAMIQFWLAGWVFFSLLIHWLSANVFWAGGWAFVGYQALCVFMAFTYWALPGLCWIWLRKSGKESLTGVLFIGLLWAGKEYLESTLFTGFGWGCLSYSQGPNLPILQWASIGGGPLITAFIVMTNAAIAQLVVEKTNRALRGICLAAIVSLLHAGGMLLLKPADYTSAPLHAGVLQSNFSVEMKWDHEYIGEMVRNAADKTRTLAANQSTPLDLMIWPESLIMDEITRPDIWAQVSGMTRELNCALYTGSDRKNMLTEQDMNSSYLVKSDGTLGDYYDKIHLAPFGEYVPLSAYFPFISKLVPAIGEIGAGHEVKVFNVKNRRFGGLICFEVLFGSMARELRDRGSDFLVVITNLGWFGFSAAPLQEVEIARMRAVETRMPVLQAANTGISGLIDPYGRFTLARSAVDRSGRYGTYADDLPPEALQMQRCMGAFSVPARAPQWAPEGPRYFPLIALGIAAAMAGLTCVFRQSGTKKKAVSKKK